MKQALLAIMLLTSLNIYAKSYERETRHSKERTVSSERKRSTAETESFLQKRKRKQNMAVSY